MDIPCGMTPAIDGATSVSSALQIVDVNSWSRAEKWEMSRNGG